MNEQEAEIIGGPKHGQRVTIDVSERTIDFMIPPIDGKPSFRRCPIVEYLDKYYLFKYAIYWDGGWDEPL